MKPYCAHCRNTTPPPGKFCRVCGNGRVAKPGEHHCHAVGCSVPVKPEKLMCIGHWSMVPKHLQQAVYANYREGQCDDKRPSREWHAAADAAINYVRNLEKE